VSAIKDLETLNKIYFFRQISELEVLIFQAFNV